MPETFGYLTLDGFTQQLLQGGDDRSLVDYVLSRGTPFAFRDSPEDYVTLRNAVARELKLPPAMLTLVGSGRLGFSLNPDKFPKIYSVDSDLDFAVVSARLFDRLWLDLLHLSSVRYWQLSPQVREWYKSHRENKIYHGRALPHRLRGASAVTREWFGAFNANSRFPQLAKYAVHGMLFRTWDHVRLYHAYGLSEIRGRLAR